MIILVKRISVVVRRRGMLCPKTRSENSRNIITPTTVTPDSHIDFILAVYFYLNKLVDRMSKVCFSCKGNWLHHQPCSFSMFDCFYSELIPDVFHRGSALDSLPLRFLLHHPHPADRLRHLRYPSLHDQLRPERHSETQPTEQYRLSAHQHDVHLSDC